MSPPIGAARVSRYAQLGDAIPAHLYWSTDLSSVSTWPDEIGSIDLDTVTGNPVLANSINSEQTVDYDGDDRHQSSATATLGSNSVYTAAGVFKRNSSDSGWSTLFEVGSGSNGYAILTEPTDGYVVVHRWQSSTNGGSVDTSPHVYVAAYDGTSVYLDIDGSTVINGVSTTAPSSPTDHISIGGRADGGEYLIGSIGAARHEAAFADATRRDELTNELGNAFGIAVST